MRNTNSLRDEIHLQHEKLNDQPFSKKLEYFWDYYKVHTIITVFLACMFGSILHSIITQKETVLSIAYINAFPNIEDEIFIEDFEAYLGLNLKKQQVVLDSTYYIDDTSTSPYAATYSQKFSTNAMAGKLDVVLADSTNFDFYGNQGFFQNLNLILPSEILEKYTDKLYYADLPTDETDQKVPIGIKIDQAKKICETSSYPKTDAYFGFVAGSNYVDNALAYLNYLEN
ncbi:MAG: hypothetical protein IKY94_00790 [Lachnospiraceae bacterium]|nr:hypothetical protein [Lachnospiraceae bacterium]